MTEKEKALIMGIFENVTLMWFIAGVFFLVLEAITPGFFLLFFGVGAWAAAIVTFCIPISAVFQWGLFMAVSIISLLAMRKRLKAIFERRARTDDAIDDPVFSSQYIGREVLVLKEIAPGRPGLVELNGSDWQARTDGQATLAQGERVIVQALSGLTLIVIKVFPAE